MKSVKAAPVRLAAQGTRVIVLKASSPKMAGIVSEVRREAHLKTYVVACDDGTTVYASANDLALEDDGTRTPLGPPREY